MRPYPIDPVLPELKEALRVNSAGVLQAPPGSGKTTRVPIALLEQIPPGGGRILVVEPRRLAAVSAARWMARGLGEPVGETLGYSIRFESRVSRRTRVEIMTDGLLARRLQSNPGLEGAAMVIFDEFHERRLQADLALALCLDIRRNLRPDLKILVMSATLDCAPVASLMGGAPVISSVGGGFAVEERYRAEERDRHLPERMAEAVLVALRETSGDILAFLPGSGEIRECRDLLAPALAGREGDCVLHPLFGDLPFEEQERAILPSTRRKIVLATNIAETSLTIEGVRVVIDGGFTRRLQYDPATGLNRLATVPVSRASAEQRKGRAGRLGPGVCYRLYSRHAYQSLTPFSPPEILVSELSSLALDLAAWGVQDPSALSWMDPPPPASWQTARQLLIELGAMDSQGRATPAGREMALLPLHPRLARLFLKAAELGDPLLGAELTALLAEREISRSHREGAPGGAPDSIGERVEILRRWRSRKEAPSWADPGALRAVEKVVEQLMGLAGRKQRLSSEEPSPMTPRLLLQAFPDRIAKRREEGVGRFLLSQGRGVKLPPSSSLAANLWIIAARVDAGGKAEGKVHLAEPVSEGLLRRELGGRIETRRQVAWEKKQGRIAAVMEERIDALVLTARPFTPTDEEVAPLLCDAIRSEPGLLIFSGEARQFQGRVLLMRKFFKEENWPDLSEVRLLQAPEDWLLPWLKGVRTRAQLAGVDILAALRGRLAGEQRRLLDRRAPQAIPVPSGRRAALNYAAGETPVLAIKLQEMFGLGETPVLAERRVKILLHLLSPSGRPVQITQDLKGFWNQGYQQVKKDLQGRYPKHPWPEDPWKALATRGAKPRGR